MAPKTNRRSFLALGGAVALAGCKTVPPTATAPKSGKPPSNAERQDHAAPQFFVGNPQSANVVHFVWSIQCTDTQDLFKGVGRDLVAYGGGGGDVVIIFSHLVRKEVEVPLGKQLLSVGPKHYGTYCLAALQALIGSSEGQLHKNDLDNIADALKLPVDPTLDERVTDLAVRSMNRYLRSADIRQTPTVTVGSKKLVEPSVNELREALAEIGIDLVKGA